MSCHIQCTGMCVCIMSLKVKEGNMMHLKYAVAPLGEQWYKLSGSLVSL